MVISRTPFRVSFFGGGTDYPAWYRENGGSVVATTIDKYCHVTCRGMPPFFDHKSMVIYSKIERVQENSEIQHPVVRAALMERGITEGVSILYDSDLPGRTGLGSSSSFMVGILNALSAWKGRMSDKMHLAREAIRLEQEVLKESVGCQDQVIAALGGLQRIDFAHNDAIVANPLIIGPERTQDLQDHLLLYFTGFSRIASEIAKEQIDRMQEKRRELARMHKMVDEAVAVLTGGDLADFGRLLDEGWSIKRTLSSRISTPFIDDMYAAAKSAGALGGKLLGAGGGGFMLIFARPQDHPQVKERLKSYLRVPFRFENEGARIMLYHPDGP